MSVFLGYEIDLTDVKLQFVISQDQRSRPTEALVSVDNKNYFLRWIDDAVDGMPIYNLYELTEKEEGLLTKAMDLYDLYHAMGILEDFPYDAQHLVPDITERIPLYWFKG